MESNDSEGNIPLSLVYKVVPWVNWDEWNYVRRSIFSSCPKLISSALQKISAWESRGCLPIAIELTAVIIEIRQKDPFFRGDNSIGDGLFSDKMLNSLYCMFILRLVNDFVEPAHKKTGRSISDLAEAVGIPRTFVDIRHESTHRCLPSLKLVRSASTKALEWLKANYWEPQSIAIHEHRKEVKSRLRALILFSRAHQISKASSVKNKIINSKRTSFLVACRKLSQINQRLMSPKSDVSKVQIVKLTRRVANLYSLYPFEVVSVLVDFFCSQSLDISDSINMEHSDDSDSSILKPISGSQTDLKMVITKMSQKRPRLLLSMLKVVLEMIDEKDSRNFENGINHLSSENQVEINQVRHLRSLVPCLFRNLKALKESGQIVPLEENQALSTNKITFPKVNLTSLLHKCLTSLVPGDKHLLKSVLLLAEMMGNRFLTQKLKKLPLIAFLDHDHFRLDDVNYNESILIKEEDSIKKAAEKLDLLKLRLMDRKNLSRSHCTQSDVTNSRWTVANSWIPCPIGMLPCSFSSSALIPVLDALEDKSDADKSEATAQNVENDLVADMEVMDCDITESCGDGSASKKLKQMSEKECSPAPKSPFLMEGRLLIDGVWMKVSDEEFASIESDIRIFA